MYESPKIVAELGREHGYVHASYQDAYEHPFDEGDIPEDSDIAVPYYADGHADRYRESFQEGCRDFIDFIESGEEAPQ